MLEEDAEVTLLD